MFIEVGQVVQFNFDGEVTTGVVEIIFHELNLIRIRLSNDNFVPMRPDYLIGNNSYCNFCNRSIPVGDDGLFIHDEVYHV